MEAAPCLTEASKIGKRVFGHGFGHGKVSDLLGMSRASHSRSG